MITLRDLRLVTSVNPETAEQSGQNATGNQNTLLSCHMGHLSLDGEREIRARDARKRRAKFILSIVKLYKSSQLPLQGLSEFLVYIPTSH
jgi:hypothetical protein